MDTMRRPIAFFFALEVGLLTTTATERDGVIVYDPNFKRSAGHKERLRHLDAIANGADGYAVTG